MSANAHAPAASQGLSQVIQAAVSAGSTAGLRHPDGTVLQYIKRAITAGTAHVPGAPSLECAQLVAAAIGA